jgi:antitoxin VapB
MVFHIQDFIFMSALFIRDETVNDLAERVQAALKVRSKTDAVRIALQRTLDEKLSTLTLSEKVRALQLSLGINGRTDGFDAKAFSDSLFED